MCLIILPSPFRTGNWWNKQILSVSKATFFWRERYAWFYCKLLFPQVKQHWIGPNYTNEGVAGNDIARTNVPDVRIYFRHETFLGELTQIFHAVKGFMWSGCDLVAVDPNYFYDQRLRTLLFTYQGQHIFRTRIWHVAFLNMLRSPYTKR